MPTYITHESTLANMHSIISSEAIRICHIVETKTVFLQIRIIKPEMEMFQMSLPVQPFKTIQKKFDMTERYVTNSK